jgi:YfiH family protein
MRTAGPLVRRTLDGVPVQFSPRAEADGFLIAFTERAGGVSRGAFQSLNLGLLTEDEPTRVSTNRSRVCAALGIPSFASGRQVHGARVARIGLRRAGAGFSDPADAVAGADGLVTSSPQVPISVLVADCVPLALFAPDRGELAVVHAGWRGLASGIVSAAIRRMAEPNEVWAVIGPSIGVDHYEVGGEVVHAIASGSEGPVRTRRSGGRLYLDLAATVAAVLEEQGVRAMECSGECTACQSERFFSYRRDGRTGRQALIAAKL